jgi:hypothetical protein
MKLLLHASPVRLGSDAEHQADLAGSVNKISYPGQRCLVRKNFCLALGNLPANLSSVYAFAELSFELIAGIPIQR